MFRMHRPERGLERPDEAGARARGGHFTLLPRWCRATALRLSPDIAARPAVAVSC
jgi:hypothetical protein